MDRKKTLILLSLLLMGLIGYGVSIKPYSFSTGRAKYKAQQSKVNQNDPSATSLKSRGQARDWSAAEFENRRLPEVSDSRRNPRASIESQLLSRDGLRVDSINQLLTEDSFENVLSRMYYESDADALALTNIYQDSLKASLKNTGSGVSLGAMACGHSVCAASFNGNIIDEEKFTNLILDSGSGAGAKIYSAVTHTLPNDGAGGPTVYRLVFSTDSRFNALTVPTK